MSTNPNQTLTLEQRIERIEAPAVAAKRASDLATLQAAATRAQTRLTEIAGELAELAARRKELAPQLAEAEMAFNALRIRDAHLAGAEVSLGRQHGECWNRIKAAADAGRPAAPPAEPRKPLSLIDARDAVWRWLKALRDRPATWTPRLGANQRLMARVRLLADVICAGGSHRAGEEVEVPDHEVDILGANVVVLERKIVRKIEPTATIAVVAKVGIRLASGTIQAGETALVDAQTAEAIRQGREPRLELIGPDADADRRVAELERKRAELEARFPGSRG